MQKCFLTRTNAEENKHRKYWTANKRFRKKRAGNGALFLCGICAIIVFVRFCAARMD